MYFTYPLPSPLSLPLYYTKGQNLVDDRTTRVTKAPIFIYRDVWNNSAIPTSPPGRKCLIRALRLRSSPRTREEQDTGTRVVRLKDGVNGGVVPLACHTFQVRTIYVPLLIVFPKNVVLSRNNTTKVTKNYCITLIHKGEN